MSLGPLMVHPLCGKCSTDGGTVSMPCSTIGDFSLLSTMDRRGRRGSRLLLPSKGFVFLIGGRRLGSVIEPFSFLLENRKSLTVQPINVVFVIKRGAAFQSFF